MIKSNTRVFRDKVKAYTLERLEYEDKPSATTKEVIAYVVDAFLWYAEGHRGVSQQENFISWLMGLPSCLNADFETYKQRKFLQEWFEQTEAEADKYSDIDVCYHFNYYVYRAFKEICKEFEIRF